MVGGFGGDGSRSTRMSPRTRRRNESARWPPVCSASARPSAIDASASSIAPALPWSWARRPCHIYADCRSCRSRLAAMMSRNSVAALAASPVMRPRAQLAHSLAIDTQSRAPFSEALTSKTSALRSVASMRPHMARTNRLRPDAKASEPKSPRDSARRIAPSDMRTASSTFPRINHELRHVGPSDAENVRARHRREAFVPVLVPIGEKFFEFLLRLEERAELEVDRAEQPAGVHRMIRTSLGFGLPEVGLGNLQCCAKLSTQ